MVNQVEHMEIVIGKNEAKKIDVSFVPCGMIAVAGDTWHLERMQEHVFLVESMVEQMGD